MSQVQESEYQGNPLLVLMPYPQSKFSFKFGVQKARLILSHIEEIRHFVEKNEKEVIKP